MSTIKLADMAGLCPLPEPYSNRAPLVRPSRALASIPDMIAGALATYDGGGVPRGASTGWHGVDEHFTVSEGQWTVVTGEPGSGKSEWLDALMVNLAESDATWEFAVYSPENYPTHAHLIKLAEKRARKPFNPGPTERMTREEFQTAARWAAEHFYWIEPEQRSPLSLIATALTSGQRNRKRGIVLDPWNTLDHERGGASETDYISLVLSEVTRAARSSGAHIFLVVHPAKLQRLRDGSRPVPTPYDLAGSSHWFNKADNIVCIHRDKATETQQVDIHVQKCRFKWSGKIGTATIRYDKVTGRYFEFAGLKDEDYADPERGAEAPDPPNAGYRHGFE